MKKIQNMTFKFYRRRLFLCLFTLIALVISGCAITRLLYSVAPQCKETFMVKTKDGWSLAVHHYVPSGKIKDKPPIVLCHGLNQNYLFWDLFKKWRLAPYLAQNGYDVWSVSLRGSGKSTKPGWSQFLELNQLPPDLIQLGRYDYAKFDWNIDDYILKDLPVLVAFIQKTTGAKELTWIGHSLGGMVLYAYLGKENHTVIKNAVLIGVAGKAIQPPSDLMKMIKDQELLWRVSLLLNTKNVSAAGAPISDIIEGPLQILSCNSKNMTKDVLTRMNTHVIENTSVSVVKQMQNMVKSGDFLSADGKENYSSNLSRFNVNLLCIAGKLDNLAPPASVRYIFHQSPSKDKTYRLFSRANGYSADYGHNDLILGKNAPEEVYPYILAWLNKH